MTPADLDALIERLSMVRVAYALAAERDHDMQIGNSDVSMQSKMFADAATALVQLRDSEALARGKLAEQMIKIERLERMKQNYYDEAVKGWSKCRAAEEEVARLTQENGNLAQQYAKAKQALGQANHELRRLLILASPAREQAMRDAEKLERERDALKAERADLIKINNGWAHEWDAMREERDALAKDAGRWSAVVMLWLMSTELTLTQDEDGRYSITCVEPVEALPAPGRWTGNDPDAAIDAAREKP